MCAGAFAIAAMEGTDGRGKWTPVPEEYCGAEDHSAAYVPPWAPVTHYSTWSPSSTSPSRTSPPRHLSPRTDNPSSFSALCPRQTPPLFRHAAPSPNQENRPNSYMNVMRCFLERWEDRRNLEMTHGGDGEPRNTETLYVQELERGFIIKIKNINILLVI